MDDWSNAEMRAYVAALTAGLVDADGAADAWGLINDDVFRRFPAVRGSGRGARGLAVMLPRPDPQLEEQIRDRYGEHTTFDYGTAFAGASAAR